MMLSDAVLSAAACEVRDAMLFALPLPQDCPDDTASPAFERRMLRLRRDPAGYGKKMARTLWQKTLHAAAMFAVTAGLSVALLCAVSPTVRAAVKQWFMELRSFDIVYYFTGEKSEKELPHYTIAELPEGYIYSREVETDDSRRVHYTNTDGYQIIFRYYYMNAGSAFSVGTENMTVSDITVGKHKGQLFLSTDAEQGSAILWTDEEQGIQFFIDAFADESVLLHMAGSVSLAKK